MDQESLLKKQKEIKAWKDSVLSRDKSKCVNCECGDRVAAVFLIPLECGGKIKVSNGATICRNCRISADGAKNSPVKIDQKTPINFFISKRLHDQVDELISANPQIGSVSSLVRRMMNSFVTEPDLYPDITQWQDAGSDVKINGWIEGNKYTAFKHICNDMNQSYTDILKALLMMAIESLSSDKH